MVVGAPGEPRPLSEDGRRLLGRKEDAAFRAEENLHYLAIRLRRAGALLPPKKAIEFSRGANLTKDLYHLEQYDLVNQIFDRLEEKDVKLQSWELLRYGSSLSEADPSAKGARKGLVYSQRAGYGRGRSENP